LPYIGNADTATTIWLLEKHGFYRKILKIILSQPFNRAAKTYYMPSNLLTDEFYRALKLDKAVRITLAINIREAWAVLMDNTFLSEKIIICFFVEKLNATPGPYFLKLFTSEERIQLKIIIQYFLEPFFLIISGLPRNLF
jgi:hypothetical protein